jgi:hypothetical protein
VKITNKEKTLSKMFKVPILLKKNYCLLEIDSNESYENYLCSIIANVVEYTGKDKRIKVGDCVRVLSAEILSSTEKADGTYHYYLASKNSDILAIFPK